MTNSDQTALYQSAFCCKDANSHEESGAGMLGKQHSRLVLHSIRRGPIYEDIGSIPSTIPYPKEAQPELRVFHRKL